MKITEEAADVFSFDLYTPAQAAALLEAAQEHVAWVPALMYGPGDRSENKELRHCTEQELEKVPAMRPHIDAALARATSIAALCWQWPLKGASDTRLVRYREGDFIRTHVDWFAGCSRPARQVSLICYLNGDFSGGETVFPRQKLSVAPKAGRALLFPSGITHPHRADAVSAGTRYVLVSWIA